jgi:hypothetical protein
MTYNLKGGARRLVGAAVRERKKKGERYRLFEK